MDLRKNIKRQVYFLFYINDRRFEQFFIVLLYLFRYRGNLTFVNNIVNTVRYDFK